MGMMNDIVSGWTVAVAPVAVAESATVIVAPWPTQARRLTSRVTLNGRAAVVPLTDLPWRPSTVRVESAWSWAWAG
ncbi:MAG: hypothetical protein QOC71_1772 [Thermoplasmata archaeon]|nr:hypothetical protein [Thermoplasmata archaeon]